MLGGSHHAVAMAAKIGAAAIDDPRAVENHARQPKRVMVGTEDIRPAAEPLAVEIGPTGLAGRGVLQIGRGADALFEHDSLVSP